MKGGAFELEIAKILSLWYSNGKRDDLVCRTDSSGGRATVRTKAKKETNKYLYGDLKHSDDMCKPLFDLWSVECKTGYSTNRKLKDGTKSRTNWCLLDLIDSTQKEPTFFQMWNQCERDALLSQRQPILIFRRNQKRPCIAMTKKQHDTINPNNIMKLDEYIHVLTCFSCEIIIMSLDMFTENFDPKKIFLIPKVKK